MTQIALGSARASHVPFGGLAAMLLMDHPGSPEKFVIARRDRQVVAATAPQK